MSRERMIYQTEETRDRILAMAQRLFTEKGLFSTQMKDVALELGISRTSLYRYYQDKFELATAILGKIFDEMSLGWTEVMSAAPVRANGLAEVEFYLREYWLSDRFLVAHLFTAEYDTFFSGARIDEMVRSGIENHMKFDLLDKLRARIVQGMEDGSIRSDLDPHLATVTLFNAVRSMQQRLILRGKVLIEVKSGELPLMMSELLRYLLAGIAARPDASVPLGGAAPLSAAGISAR
ncbi:MAG: TetR/AcrR family transcriptional regulator [Rectinemataceae bacterium]|nr:TetR/AcrR family transcriptional regulator [Rectinemataceae bacterium]